MQKLSNSNTFTNGITDASLSCVLWNEEDVIETVKLNFLNTGNLYKILEERGSTIQETPQEWMYESIFWDTFIFCQIRGCLKTALYLKRVDFSRKNKSDESSDSWFKLEGGNRRRLARPTRSAKRKLTEFLPRLTLQQVQSRKSRNRFLNTLDKNGAVSVNQFRTSHYCLHHSFKMLRRNIDRIIRGRSGSVLVIARVNPICHQLLQRIQVSCYLQHIQHIANY